LRANKPTLFYPSHSRDGDAYILTLHFSQAYGKKQIGFIFLILALHFSEAHVKKQQLHFIALDYPLISTP
jgi:hypothetical protein